MKTCANCSNEVEDKAVFCTNCGSKTFKKKLKKAPIAFLMIALIVLVSIFGKDYVKYSYYIVRGNNESSISQSINYYVEAIKLKYNKNLITKIDEKIRKDDNFEVTIETLREVLRQEDLHNIYVNIYKSKAKENFNAKNYETTWDYLEKAAEYNYNIETFEYYNDLVKLYEKEEAEVKQAINNEDKKEKVIEVRYINSKNSYYLLYDSSNRYLTEGELSFYTKEDLGYIRNEIYARHGYVFKTEKYRDYFMSQEWYQPTPNYKLRFNSFEKYNIELIKHIESKI